MVFKKRQDHGFNGFRLPTIPRAPRSVRRGLRKKTVEDTQICAFELLASIAGKLLSESESSASSNASEGIDLLACGKDAVKQEREFEDKPFKAEWLYQRNCGDSSFAFEMASQNISHKSTLKEFSHSESDDVLERTSFIKSFDCSQKTGGDAKSVIFKSKADSENYSSKVEGGSPQFGESCDANVNIEAERRLEVVGLKNEDANKPNICSSKVPTELFLESSAAINSDSNIKLPLRQDSVPNACSPRHRNDIKLGSRDNDENFSRCFKHSTKLKAFRPPTRADRRIRKLLTSKYWKVAPKLKDCELPRSAFVDGGLKPLYRKRKTCHDRQSRQKCQRDILFKRRKLFDQISVVTSDGGFSSESVSNSPEKGMTEDKNDSAAILHGANGLSSSVLGHQASFHSKDSHVKFSIKSFRVPELFIEVPETATVGSLKRTIMEAVTSILGSGLDVGILLQGKKVRDDNRTLTQTGISCKDNLDSLGFMLEPNTVQTPPPMCSSDLPPLLSCDSSQLLTRSPENPVLDSGISDALPDPPLTNSSNHVDSNHDTVSSPTDMNDKTTLDTKAIVAVPAMSMEALAVVPLNQKTRRSELVQRRTRRPFSVSEVEALVHAVEELGTGRWRDVKLRAFENADHRTYVDLKDKWKTLVHTAKIAPQQRRGEPVPQELLDRVLAAHSYWSQHQAKPQGKHQAGTPKIMEAPAEVPVE
ncbi:telomere repeat-binding protein 3 isoform X1 [Quercus suber]|uniref:telomere repeat-binding protein 3 isoform X1 n=1 Tax=Quercus suber TaxID=58331 RepID=UPI000CE1ECE1|nr:telomere repeat-binding protein 3-like isoform X1 [Quercus suber]POF19588.1 telomere repeat-binding protein 4 [Quercus suber]